MANIDCISTRKRGSKFIDLTGQKFGRLEVIGLADIERERPHWECLCECGQIRLIKTGSLRSGHTKSCGCLSKEIAASLKRTHGLWRSEGGCPEYKAWNAMKQRCYNPKNKRYKNYGGRGIEVCAEWRDSFEAFYNYVGTRPSKEYSIDRINNDGNYQPGNVRWATTSEQALNKSVTSCLSFNGQQKSITEWAKELGLKAGTISSRLHNYGWCVDCSLLPLLAVKTTKCNNPNCSRKLTN